MMHCAACHQEVDEGRAMPMLAPGLRDWEGGEGSSARVFLTLFHSRRFHLRYVEGALLDGPETSSLHGGPLICGPLE
jgi:hypothetical protein